MQIHEIRKPKSLKSKKRVARGGKRGTYSGRGIKGQKSRSGGNLRPGFDGKNTSSVKRTTKISGFTSPNLPNEILDMDILEKYFKTGDKVNPKTLKEKKLVKLNKKSRARRRARVKILANGKLTKKLEISDCLVSKSAQKIIEKAGGKITQEKKEIKKKVKKEVKKKK